MISIQNIRPSEAVEIIDRHFMTHVHKLALARCTEQANAVQIAFHASMAGELADIKIELIDLDFHQQQTI